MKQITIWVLLAAAFGFFLQTTLADSSPLSLKLIEKLHTEESFDLDISSNSHVLAADILDKKYVENDLPEIPLELDYDTMENRAVAICSINIRSGLTEPQPVFLETNATSFYSFTDIGNMQVDNGKTMQMFCPDQFKLFSQTLITATCVGGTTFKVNGTDYKFSELTCKTWPDFVVKRTGSSCNGDGVMLNVGFEVSSTRFVEQMQICFNEEEEVTRYVFHSLYPGNRYYQTGVDRISFREMGFFGGKNVNQLYTQKSQKKTIMAQLGSGSEKYFNSKNYFLSRGHMAAKADLMYGAQQRGTFIFINVAPQWQSFNAGNWARVEDGVRDFAYKNNINVQCYTGVYGISTLTNEQGYETPLYLTYDINNNGLIPVPKLYFRVVIQRDTEKGIVFVGVNNPHLTMEQIEREYIICNDVSDQVKYINWNKTNIQAGYSYACEVSDFLRTVTTLPNLSANGGLLV